MPYIIGKYFGEHSKITEAVKALAMANNLKLIFSFNYSNIVHNIAAHRAAMLNTVFLWEFCYPTSIMIYAAEMLIEVIPITPPQIKKPNFQKAQLECIIYSNSLFEDAAIVSEETSIRTIGLLTEYGIKPLSEAVLKFGDFSLYQLVEIVKELGIESIKSLSEAGFKFGDFSTYRLKETVKDLGIESIKPLSEAGVKFGAFPSHRITEIVIELGIESIKSLFEAGCNFGDFPSHRIIEIVKELGIESIKPLYEAGANVIPYAIAQQDELSEVNLLVEHSPELTPEYTFEAQLV